MQKLILFLLFLSLPLQAAAQGLTEEERSRMVIEDRVREITRDVMRRCWRMPEGDARGVRVTASFDLNSDGTLASEPLMRADGGNENDPTVRQAIEAARLAVINCAPYPFSNDPELVSHYEIWREMSLLFWVP